MKRFIFCMLGWMCVSVYASDAPVLVAVGEAELMRERIGIPAPVVKGDLSPSQKTVLDNIVRVMRSDFGFYKKTFVVSEEGMDWAQYDSPVYDKSKAPVDVVLELECEAMKPSPRIRIRVVKLRGKKEELLQHATSLSTDSARVQAHEWADLAYTSIVGKKSVFTSQIVFVSDRESTRTKRIKEIYIMDFDGANIRQLTHRRSIAISPAISDDKSKVLYSVINTRKGTRNIDMFILDLKTGNEQLVSSRRGINSGGIFSKDGASLFLSLSYSGNTEIYQLAIQSGVLQKITNHFAEDVDPSLSADGKSLAFLSSRSGQPMIYTLDPSGMEKNVKRVSFVGKFNATPRFSPDGKEIVFAAWSEDDVFDLYRINADGTGLVRLTKGTGYNEEPVYSPDGQFVAFATFKAHTKEHSVENIHIMDKDGEILGALTSDFGNCTSPRWSN